MQILRLYTLQRQILQRTFRMAERQAYQNEPQKSVLTDTKISDQQVSIFPARSPFLAARRFFNLFTLMVFRTSSITFKIYTTIILFAPTLVIQSLIQDVNRNCNVVVKQLVYYWSYSLLFIQLPILMDLLRHTREVTSFSASSCQ